MSGQGRQANEANEAEGIREPLETAMIGHENEHGDEQDNRDREPGELGVDIWGWDRTDPRKIPIIQLQNRCIIDKFSIICKQHNNLNKLLSIIKKYFEYTTDNKRYIFLKLLQG